jgi:drug/metabolite transporter (DMT)-like permease
MVDATPNAPRAALARPPAGDLALLGVAVLFISTSAPIIAAVAAPALAIAFYRCLFGGGATGLWVAWRGRADLARLGRRQWAQLVVAGLLLGAHFAAWIPSLRFTSVAASTALVATQPVWAALIARARGTHVPVGAWIGIGVALLGVLAVTGIDASVDASHLIGDALALAGAVFMAGYVSVAEGVRRTVSTSTTTFIAYLVAAVPPLVLCLLLAQPLGGYSARDWLLIAALTAGAQLLGHTVIARVLKSTSATVTSLAILFEVPGAILIAAVAIGQTPPLTLLPAVALLFVGLFILIRATPSQTESSPV